MGLFHLRQMPLDRFPRARARKETIARMQSRFMFPDLRGFAFLGKEDTYLRSNSVGVNGCLFASVGSSGHRIRLNDELNFALLVPLEGKIRVERQRAETVAMPGGILNVRLGDRTTTVANNFIGIVSLIPKNILGERAALFDPDSPPMIAESTDCVYAGSGLGAALRRQVLFVVAELDRSDILLRSERVSRATVNVLADLVVEHWIEQRRETCAYSMPPTASVRQVSRAEEWMRTNLTEPVSIGDVAAHIGISVRSLQAAFRQFRGTTPRDFLSARRLERVRLHLLEAGPSATVTSIIYDCGINNPGRFAARYREIYGELPSATLSRSRGAS